MGHKLKIAGWISIGAMAGALTTVSLQTVARGSLAPLPLEELQQLAAVFGMVKSDYVEPVDDKTLLENAIRGMLTGLDPHSAYLDADAFKDLQVSTQGEFGGLGIEVGMEDGLVKVVAPIEDTPAWRAGIKAGLSAPQARALLPQVASKPRDPEAERAAMQALLDCRDGRSLRFRCEYRTHTRHGHWRWFRGEGQVVDSADGQARPTMQAERAGVCLIDNGDGLELTRGAAFNLVADNVFRSTAANPEPSQGIEILRGNDNVVSGNRFEGYSDGLQINWGDRNYITANTFTGTVNVNGGTVTLGNAAALGSTANTLNVGSTGTVDVNGKVLWTHRVPTPYNSAALATAGGLAFVGDWDRHFYAFDAATGRILWQTRLPTSARPKRRR